MRYELRHLRYFIAVAEELHFRRAATRLNIAQPALSRAIRHLEAEMGVRLFERSNRQVALTPAGALLLESAREILSGLETAVLRARKAEAGEIGTITVSYTDFGISGALPPIIQRFRERYPDITVEMTHGFTYHQLEEIESHRLDFGFLTGPVARPDFGTVTVQTDRFVAVLHEGHPLAREAEIELRDLAGEPFILGAADTWKHYLDHLYRLCRSAGFEPRIVQTAFNSEGIFGLIACRMGITLYASCAENYIRKELVVRPLKDCDETIPTLAVWNKASVTPIKQRFIEMLAEFDVVQGASREPDQKLGIVGAG